LANPIKLVQWKQAEGLNMRGRQTEKLVQPREGHGHHGILIDRKFWPLSIARSRRAAITDIFFKPRHGSTCSNLRQNLAKCISVIDLLFQLFHVLAVLAVISLFLCTIPIWLVVLVAVLLLR
jgi:hypothetical protein